MITCNVSGAIAKLKRLSAKLARVAAGEPAERTAELLGEEVGEDLGSVLEAHRRTGNAAASMTVQTSAKGLQVTAAPYLKFKEWWPLRAGFPAQYSERARAIFKEQVERLLSG